MSGICALFKLDLAPVSAAEPAAMVAQLARRGPEGVACWRDGPVGLGHSLLATTPELASEPQPLRHAASGCVISADLRLDNRAELLARLGLAGRGEEPGDAGLLLAAYLEWGEDCLDRLLGDFAFVLWDPRQRKLFGARDHFGLRPLYYHHAPGRLFACASEARSIIALPAVPFRIDDGRVADFLVPELEWIDYDSTFFAGIHRLPPGHKLTITPAGLAVSQYWRLAAEPGAGPWAGPGPDPAPGHATMSDEAYREGFLEVFTQAVDARLRAPDGAVGAMLSGGMDSGSVVAVAKELLAARGVGPLHTYSGALMPGADCAETRAILAATALPGLAPTLIRPEQLDEFIPQLVAGHEEPFDGEIAMLKAIYLAARSQGHRVVLDGAGGDVVFATGSYLVRLLRRGRLVSAAREIAAESGYWGVGQAPEFFRYARAAFVPETLKQLFRPGRAQGRIRGALKSSLIAPDFARGVGIEARFARMRDTFSGGWTQDYAQERCNAVLPNMTAGRERYGRAAAAAGVEARDPFMDKRVVDYCTRLPGHLRLKNGWPKMLLREVMAERLPDEVRWQRGKPHVGWVFHATLARRLVAREEFGLPALQAQLQAYVDPAALADRWQAFTAGGDAERIYSACILAAWLRENGQRPLAIGARSGRVSRN